LEAEADAAGIRTMRAALTMPLDALEPIISRHRASRARTSPDGAAALYFRMILAAFLAGDRDAVRLLAYGPSDYARSLLVQDPLPIAEAMLLEQEADTEEDMAQSRLAFGSNDAIWDYIEKTKKHIARQGDALISAYHYANERHIRPPVDTRHRKPEAMVL